MKKKIPQTSELNGISLSEGIAIGKAFIYNDILTRDVSSYKIARKNIPYELKRIVTAIGDVKKELYKLGRSISHNVSSSDGSIFLAQKAMLEDASFLSEIHTELQKSLMNAEQVVKNVFRRYINRFSDATSETIKAKAGDLRDILRKVLRNLMGINTSVLEKLPANAIVVTRRLLPSDTIHIDKRNVAGIVIQEGSVHSHSALLARSLSIPAACSDGKSLDFINEDDRIIVDGSSGSILCNPSSAMLTSYREKHRLLSGKQNRDTRIVKNHVKTSRGKTIIIYANASNHSEVSQAVLQGCDGIGLFRTESLYLESKTMPTEKELYDKLRHALAATENLKVTLRVLDIGGDKKLPYFDTGDPISPFLGLRGIRILLKNPDILSTQLKVFVRLGNKFNIRVLLPMITLAEEITTVRKMLDEYCQQYAPHRRKRMELGAMIETPAAVLAIDRIIKVSDFVSIGTNDLTQYVMAAGRESPEVASYFDKGAEHMFTMAKMVADAARKSGKECSVCGEMANDKLHLEHFVKAGISHFSVSPYRIPDLKRNIRNL